MSPCLSLFFADEKSAVTGKWGMKHEGLHLRLSFLLSRAIKRTLMYLQVFYTFRDNKDNTVLFSNRKN